MESTFLLREDIFLEDVQARLCVLRFGEVVCSVNRLLLEFIQRDFGQYAMLKAIPNKNAGFIILLTSIFILFYLLY